MARPKKYDEQMTNMTFYVPQSRKEEIRELVRGVLNGDENITFEILPKLGFELTEIVHDDKSVSTGAYKLGRILLSYDVHYEDWLVSIKEVIDRNKFHYLTSISTTKQLQSIMNLVLPQPPKSK